MATISVLDQSSFGFSSSPSFFLFPSSFALVLLVTFSAKVTRTTNECCSCRETMQDRQRNSQPATTRCNNKECKYIVVVVGFMRLHPEYLIISHLLSQQALRFFVLTTQTALVMDSKNASSCWPGWAMVIKRSHLFFCATTTGISHSI